MGKIGGRFSEPTQKEASGSGSSGVGAPVAKTAEKTSAADRGEDRGKLARPSRRDHLERAFTHAGPGAQDPFAFTLDGEQDTAGQDKNWTARGRLMTELGRGPGEKPTSARDRLEQSFVQAKLGAGPGLWSSAYPVGGAAAAGGRAGSSASPAPVQMKAAAPVQALAAEPVQLDHDEDHDDAIQMRSTAVAHDGGRNVPSRGGAQGARPGRRTTPSALDQRGRNEAIRDVAASGLRGGGQALPYLDIIQRAFGHHDVRAVRAHLGTEASQASRALGAHAYTMGNQVAFGRTPDLHTAAHEAAHVVQQRAGVQVEGGVGQRDDAFERHADAVADRVVRGQSAEDLLDKYVARAIARVQRQASGDGPVQFSGSVKTGPVDPAGPGEDGGEYIVKQGETLEQIAKKNGISIQEILQMNDGLTKVTAGMKICLPAKCCESKPEQDPVSVDPDQPVQPKPQLPTEYVYIVQGPDTSKIAKEHPKAPKGYDHKVHENMTFIAAHFGVSLKELEDANKWLLDRKHPKWAHSGFDYILPGDELKVPSPKKNTVDLTAKHPPGQPADKNEQAKPKPPKSKEAAENKKAKKEKKKEAQQKQIEAIAADPCKPPPKPTPQPVVVKPDPPPAKPDIPPPAELVYIVQGPDTSKIAKEHPKAPKGYDKKVHENMTFIAAHFGVSLKELEAANPYLLNRKHPKWAHDGFDYILPNDELKVPGAKKNLQDLTSKPGKPEGGGGSSAAPAKGPSSPPPVPEAPAQKGGDKPETGGAAGGVVEAEPISQGKPETKQAEVAKDPTPGAPENVNEEEDTYYTVQKFPHPHEDNLTRIAHQYGVTLVSLKAANTWLVTRKRNKELYPNGYDFLKPGDKIHIAGKKKKSHAKKADAPKVEPPKPAAAPKGANTEAGAAKAEQPAANQAANENAGPAGDKKAGKGTGFDLGMLIVKIYEKAWMVGVAEGVAGKLLQLKSSGEAPSVGEGAAHAVAAGGVSGGGGRLPYLERIQASFGSHDVSGVQAHVGGEAASANRALGAEAYATGDHVAFSSAPTLHTAAHEAAHVVQQRRGGVPGGVSREGDVFERQADAVADRVVRGESAADLLGGGGVAGPATGGRAIQRKAIHSGGVIGAGEAKAEMQQHLVTPTPQEPASMSAGPNPIGMPRTQAQRQAQLHAQRERLAKAKAGAAKGKAAKAPATGAGNPHAEGQKAKIKAAARAPKPYDPAPIPESKTSAGAFTNLLDAKPTQQAKEIDKTGGKANATAHEEEAAFNKSLPKMELHIDGAGGHPDKSGGGGKSHTPTIANRAHGNNPSL